MKELKLEIEELEERIAPQFTVGPITVPGIGVTIQLVNDPPGELIASANDTDYELGRLLAFSS